jgi:hypothetical protein
MSGRPLRLAWSVGLALAGGVGCSSSASSSSPPPPNVIVDAALGDTGSTIVDGGVDGTTCKGGSCDAAPRMGCDGGSCVPPMSVDAGGHCTFTADCVAGTYCGADGTCDAAGDGGAGATCTSTADCVRGAVCYRASPGLYGVCTAPDGVTIPAESDGGYDAGFVTGGPGTAQGLGGPCKTLLDCAAGLACSPTTNTCEPGVPGEGLPVPWSGVTCNDAVPADAGTSIRAYFELPAADGTPPYDFFRLPFPNDVRRNPTTGHINLTGFPDPGTALLGFDIVAAYVSQSEADLDGFGTNQEIYFRFSGEIDFNSLTLGTGGTIQTYDLTAGQPTLSVSYNAATSGNHYICANNIKISVGTMVPGHTYGVTLGTGITDSVGHPVVADAQFPPMLSATAPTDSSLTAAYAAYAPLRSYLASQQINPSTILDATVFTTQQVTTEVPAIRTAIRAKTPPTASGFVLCSEGGPVSPCDDGLTGAAHVRGCIPPFSTAYDQLQGQVTIPIMQQGTRPYSTVGQGAIELTDGGVPIIQGTEEVCVSITVPHGVTQPAAGWPTILYAHGTGGDYLSGIQEGLAAAVTSIAIDGNAPAQFAFVSYDGVMTGPRAGTNVTQPADTLFFNYANPVAARDNVLQGAADVFTLVWGLETITLPNLPASGTTTAFDPTHVYFIGHSQGSTVGLPAAAFELGLAGMVFSGAGGDLRETLVTKTNPVDIAALTPYVLEDSPVDSTHPALNMFQAFFERADPLNYGGLLLLNLPMGMTPRPLVQTYGLNDTYTPDPTLQEVGDAIGLPAAGPTVGTMPWPGGSPLMLPVSKNFATASVNVTAAVVEADPMGAYDGHFVLFDNPTLQSEVMQFLGTAATGTATIQQ